LSAAGVDTGCVFTDKLSDSVKTERPGLTALLDYARPDDTIVVTAIDRLGGSVAEVTHTIADLGERGILLRAIREGIDTATPTGGQWPRSCHPRRTRVRTGQGTPRGIPGITAVPPTTGQQTTETRRRPPSAAAPAGRHRPTRPRTGRRLQDQLSHRLPLPGRNGRTQPTIFRAGARRRP
jgi:hypothetical protein